MSGGLTFYKKGGENMPVRILVRLKACIRCHGDVAWDKDQYGEWWRCLMCGREIA
jgi:hypothetical protein